MTLPFPKDNHIRKYNCFVCGVGHIDFEEYKTHILDNHDEGTDFVICPLERCGAPVRCIKSHFAVKHRGERLPKVPQMKATVWKDMTRDGKMKGRRPKFREGWVFSPKNGKDIHYRSGLECDLYSILEQKNTVISFEIEPFKVQYSFRGNPHEYTPDLSVVFDDGHTEIWEVKPSNQTHLPKNKAKWVSCQQYCEQRGYKFMVVTEKGIEKLKMGQDLT